jgi:hypothetical protein
VVANQYSAVSIHGHPLGANGALTMSLQVSDKCHHYEEKTKPHRTPSVLNVTFILDASENLTTHRRALAQSIVKGVLDSLGSQLSFALVAFHQTIEGYESGTPRPVYEKEMALAWLNLVQAQGKADFSTLLRRLVSLREANVLVLLCCGGSNWAKTSLLPIAQEAPKHLFFFAVDLECERSFLEELGGQFSGGSQYSRCSSSNWRATLLQIHQGLRAVPIQMAQSYLADFKRLLDLHFESKGQSKEPSQELLVAFEQAVWATQNTQHIVLVRSELQQGRVGMAYAWFGGALAQLEKLSDFHMSHGQMEAEQDPPLESNLPKPQELERFIDGMELDLRRKQIRPEEEMPLVGHDPESTDWGSDAHLKFEQREGAWEVTFQAGRSDSLIELVGSLPGREMPAPKVTVSVYPKPANLTRVSRYRARMWDEQIVNWSLTMALDPTGLASGCFRFQDPSKGVTCSGSFRNLSVLINGAGQASRPASAATSGLRTPSVCLEWAPLREAPSQNADHLEMEILQQSVQLSESKYKLVGTPQSQILKIDSEILDALEQLAVGVHEDAMRWIASYGPWGSKPSPKNIIEPALWWAEALSLLRCRWLHRTLLRWSEMTPEELSRLCLRSPKGDILGVNWPESLKIFWLTEEHLGGWLVPGSSAQQDLSTEAFLRSHLERQLAIPTHRFGTLSTRGNTTLGEACWEVLRREVASRSASWSALESPLSGSVLARIQLVVLSERDALLEKAHRRLQQWGILNARVVCPSLELDLRNLEGQFDAERLVQDLEAHVKNVPLLLVVAEDLYRSSKPEWVFCFGLNGQKVAVLSSHRLQGERLDKMLYRYAAKVTGTFTPSSDPKSVFFEPILGWDDIDRIDMTRA